MSNELVVRNGLITNGDSNLNGLIKNTGFVNVSSASANTENVSVMKVSGTGGAESWQLDDGVDGQRLTVYSSGGTFGRTTIRPISSSGWSSFEITAVGDCIELIYDSSAGWIITGNRNGAIS
jgi:hypothetical protein